MPKPDTAVAADINWSWPPRGVSKDALAATDAICTEMQRRSGVNTVTCAFSGGKDSVVMMYVLRHYFAEVVPVYWYLVPNLQFVERSLAYYERVFGVSISRLPHPDRLDMIAKWSFQPPSRLNVLEVICEDLPAYKMDELWEAAMRTMGIARTIHCTGIRASDSPTRAGLYRKYGGLAPNGRVAYPIITWRLDDIEGCLDHSRLLLPPEYAFIGRSFDGIVRRYTAVIKEHWPDDWERMLQDFPLAELEFFRAKYVARNIPPLYKFQGGK